MLRSAILSAQLFFVASSASLSVCSFRFSKALLSVCDLALSASGRVQKVGQYAQRFEQGSSGFGSRRPRQRVVGCWRIHCNGHHGVRWFGAHCVPADDRRCWSGRTDAVGRENPRPYRAGLPAYPVQVTGAGIGWCEGLHHPVSCFVFPFVAGSDDFKYANPMGDCSAAREPMGGGFRVRRGRFSRYASTSTHPSDVSTAGRVALTSGEGAVERSAKQCGFKISRFSHALMRQLP